MGRPQERQRSVLGAIDRLFRSGTAAGLSDGQLLERFTTRHDEAAEAAFAALVERHGPTVWRVCRRLLSSAHDAQDAFQATFLILVRKAGTLRRRESLASWLRAVALRVATHSRAASVRRRAVEAVAGSRLTRERASDDRCPEIWDEVDRLPQRYRKAVVLCYLEGLTHEQAAHRLGWPVGTVRSRLARARERLRGRLVRRGLAPPSAELGALMAFKRAVPLPPNLVDPTVRAAMRVAAESGLVSSSPLALAEGVLRTMFFTKLKSAVLALVTTGILVVAGVGVYGYQASRPGPSSGLPQIAEGVSDDAAPGVPGPEQAEPAPLPEKSDLAEQDLSHATKIVALARAAREQQEDGDLEAASETTHQIEVLAHEWSEMLRHPDATRSRLRSNADRKPLFKKKKAPTYTYPKRENTFDPRSATETAPVKPGVPSVPPARLAEPPLPPGAPMAPGAPPAPPAPAAPMLPGMPGVPGVAPALPAPGAPMAPGVAPAPPAPPSDVDRRLDEVERRIEQLLRMLREEGRSDPSSRRLPDKP
jgi:RNA polymerase sigma-70 factor (ECF subfamily)